MFEGSGVFCELEFPKDLLFVSVSIGAADKGGEFGFKGGVCCEYAITRANTKNVTQALEQ